MSDPQNLEVDDAVMRNADSVEKSLDSSLEGYAGDVVILSPWEQFLNFIVDKLRRYVYGEYVSTDDASSMLSEEDFQKLHEFLLDPGRPVGPAEIVLYVNQTRLETLPVEILFEILDRLFNFHEDDEEALDIGMIHTLHGLRLMSEFMRDVVNHWVESSRPKWEKFKFLELQCYSSRADVKADPNCPWSIFVFRVPGLEKSNVAIQAATSCVECFHFLVEQKLIPLGGYDMNGESFLNWAITRNCQPVVDYMLDVMPVEDFFYSTALRIGYQEDKHSLATLLENGNQKGFEKLINKLAESRDVEQWDLGWSLNHRRLKLKMCSFLSAKNADLLLKKLKVNIGDVVMDQKKARKRPRAAVDEPNYGRFGAFLAGAETSSWHEAARHNPDGEAFMVWLSKNAKSEPTNINKQGYTPLMYAALGENVTAFKWLAKHSDPTAPLSSRPNSREPFALRAAAFNQTFHSDEMFEIILDEMPDEFFRNFALVSNVFGWIIDGLWSFRFNPREMNPTKPWPNDRVLIMFLAKEKCQQLVNRLPETWASSTWQMHAMERARFYGYSFLPPSMIWRKSNKQHKPKKKFGLALPVSALFGR
ncbi:hypothetical protein N7486_010314 [Penicillium sp. IBT 16267x]|nr:hypothetical protein N7486_010314 [Penicillium sp. IBT 16267x]